MFKIKAIFPLFALLMLMITLPVNSQENQSQLTTGPEKGSLMVVGGGRLTDVIMERFLELAGGSEAKIVVIPTASGAESYDDDYYFLQRLKDFGAINVSLLHTYDKEEADSEGFIQPLKDAQAVWFGGGRQWRLVDAYADTKTEKMIWEVLSRGGVVGGSSAGATIQGSYLARGDTQNNQVMMGDHEEGFGFIKNVAIDQHLLARNRQFDMFSILKHRPELLGIGIDERTAIVVNQNTFEVLGDGKVAIYDGTFWSREGSELKNLPPKEHLFYFLQRFDKYDLKNRQVITDTNGE